MLYRITVLVLCLAACNDSSSNGRGDMSASGDGFVTLPDLAGSDGVAPPDMGKAQLGCIENKAYCSAWNIRTYCDDSSGLATMKTENCPSGCFQGACSTSNCADECSIGATSNLGTCKLWEMSSNSFVSSDQVKLMDRAREHDAQTMRVTEKSLGAMINAEYTDSTHTTLAYYWGTADAAIWSGSWLAAQSWRLLATGSRDAADEVAAKVTMLHDWFRITGDVGYVARLALPRMAAVPTEYNWQGQDYCTGIVEHHCNVDFKGGKWDWIGGLSRDQYTGVMLGLGLSYLASPDEEVRKLAREDVTTVALELTKMRSIPTTIVVDGVPSSVTLNLENVILAPSEFVGGKVQIELSTGSISSDDNGEHGIREFLPDFSVMVKQVLPFLGGIPIPRASTAMMLGGFFNIALRASKGVPGYESTYNTLKAYYDAHADSWLNTASLWTHTGGCNPKYYPNHIAYIQAYMWALLEEDPVRRDTIRNGILDDLLWTGLKNDKNSYFAYLWGGTRNASMPPDATEIMNANTQLGQFMNAPKGRPAIHHLGDYPNDSMCSIDGQPASTVAVDVKDRDMDDSIWQRGVWKLESGGDPNVWFPATDYVGAYWAARYHSLLTDDRPGTCTRWN
jgi:hypothetical protein